MRNAAAAETVTAHRNGARRKGKAAVASYCSERSRACRRRRRLFELPLKSISCSAATCAADETPRSTLKRTPSAAPSPAACSASLLHGGTPNVSAVVASTLPLPRGCHQPLLFRDSFCKATEPCCTAHLDPDLLSGDVRSSLPRRHPRLNLLGRLSRLLRKQPVGAGVRIVAREARQGGFVTDVLALDLPKMPSKIAKFHLKIVENRLKLQ